MRFRPEHHLEQEEIHACVAACAGMLRRLRGEAFSEAALMESATASGLPMRVAAEAVGGTDGHLSPTGLLGWLDLLGSGDRCLIVWVCGPIYVKLCGVQPGGHPSRHGALAAPGDYGAPHAVLLVDADAETVRYFDPWYPAQGQPLSMSRDDLVEMFMLSVVGVSL